MDQDATWYEGRPRPRPHCVRWGPSSSPKMAHPQFSVHVCCGQTSKWNKMPLGREVGLVPGYIVLDGDPAPPVQKRGAQQPPFRSMSIVAKRLDGSFKMSLCTEIGLSPGHTVLDGDPPPPPKRGHSSPHFSADVYCGQTAGWIKMPLGTEIGLGSCHIVLYMETQLPPQERGTAPNFWPMSVANLRPNGCMDQDTTWNVDRRRSRPYCVRCGPWSPHGRAQQPHFSARVYCGQRGRPSRLLLSSCQGLRGSVSPVLTATGLVNGRWRFSTP